MHYNFDKFYISGLLSKIPLTGLYWTWVNRKGRNYPCVVSWDRNNIFSTFNNIWIVSWIKPIFSSHWCIFSNSDSACLSVSSIILNSFWWVDGWDYSVSFGPGPKLDKFLHTYQKLNGWKVNKLKKKLMLIRYLNIYLFNADI